MAIIQWILKSDAAKHAHERISSIHVSADPPYPVHVSHPHPKTNHWVLHCRISDDSSICIDPSPSGPNLSLVMILQRKNGLGSKDAVKVVELEACDLHVKDLVTLLLERGFDHYRFHETGQGCRFWVSNVLELQRKERFIADGKHIDDALQALKLVWDLDVLATEEDQTGIMEGRFVKE
ncbi:hypothetical protein MMC25_002191 [Agyrium rufum]|nr:hypothetical protein [Agyrium rufum]